MIARFVFLAVVTLARQGQVAAQGALSLSDLQARAHADSNDPVAHFALAQAYLQAKQVDSACRSLEAAILIDREFAPAYLFLSRVRTRLRVPAQTDSALDARISRVLAARVAEVRWGPDAYDEFLSRTSSDVQAALGYFPRLHELLAAPHH